MSRIVRFALVALPLLVLTLVHPLRAENEGQADLDRATEAKLAAEKVADLTEVIKLCESALQKGLDKENTEFAKNLESSALLQRATFSGNAIFKEGPVDPRWTELRKQAMADLEKAVKLVPRQPEALLLIARLSLLPEGDPKRAAGALDALLGMEIDEPEVRVKAMSLRANLESDDKKKLVLLDEAVRLAPTDADPIRAPRAAPSRHEPTRAGAGRSEEGDRARTRERLDLPSPGARAGPTEALRRGDG